MSDHWNSLANILGTPSLPPPKPKTEGPAPVVTKQPSERASTAASEVSAEKPKAEKSRLKTSWDAVANFFGVTSKETEQASEPTDAGTTAAEAATHPTPVALSKPTVGTPKPPGKKGKPSMWESTPEESDESERPVPTSGAKESPKREPTRREISERREPVRSEAKSRDALPRDIHVPREGETFQDSDPSREPERRSHRRPPRRGRDAQPRDRDSQPSERAVKKDREPPRRSEREASQSERTVSPRAASQKSSENRTTATNQESRPSKKSSGFGAGIVGDDDFDNRTVDSFDDDRDSDEFHSHSRALTDESDDRLRKEVSLEQEQEGQPRRRRRRGGRGRKHRDEAESNDAETSIDARAGRSSRDEDAEQSADDGPSIRHAKIPSWTETIGVLVEANMLNHQRSTNTPRGNPRGRGRR